MTEYEFQLDFKLNQNEDPGQYLDALYESGCDDAAVGIGTPGRIRLDFIRTANDPIDALVSSIKDVVNAIPGARLIRALPYLVNLSELGLMFACTKQNMSKYARGEAANAKSEFPLPVISGKNSYWYALDVARWLNDNSPMIVNPAILEILSCIFSLNKAIDQEQKKDREMTESFLQLIKHVA